MYQSNVSPVPPRMAGSKGVEEVEVGVEALRRRTSARRATRAALMTCAPVRRRDLLAVRGALVAVQLDHRQPERVDATRATSSSGALTKTPQTSAWRLQRARDQRGLRGLAARAATPGQRITPIAQAPRVDRQLGVVEAA